MSVSSSGYARTFAEVAFVSIYQDQVLFHELCAFLEEFGYRLYSLYNVYKGAGGQLVAADAIFLRSGLLASA